MNQPAPPFRANATIHVMRLTPGQDLKRSLQAYAAVNKIKAAVVLTCVGSLTQYNLRFANQKKGNSQKGHFEIVSLTGTLSESSVHLHISVSDAQGTTTGGHLLDENLIYTTAEIALAELPGLEFERAFDEASGYHELKIKK